MAVMLNRYFGLDFMLLRIRVAGRVIVHRKPHFSPDCAVALTGP